MAGRNRLARLLEAGAVIHVFGRLAELREGVWMRPANVNVRLPDPLDVDVELMTARPGDLLHQLIPDTGKSPCSSG